MIDQWSRAPSVNTIQRPGSILIVDNEPAIVDVLVEILADAGYSTSTASNGASAFRLIIAHAPALLLLDMWLPDMRASELIAQLHSAHVATMPIVLMSTTPRENEQHVPGTSLRLTKPFDINALLACVDTYVQPIHATPITI